MPASVSTDVQTIRAAADEVHERIERACQRAGRRSDEVTLIAVSKTFPLARIEAAMEAGLHHFGENKVQELTAKAEQRPGWYGGGEVVWHMVGHLQRNKAKDVVACADLFHALDSPRLAKELDKRAAAEGRVFPCYAQVNVSGEESKYGVSPEALTPLLDRVAAYEHLRVIGLMTLAAPGLDAAALRHQFALLRRLRDGYDSRSNPQVDLHDLSMGMSGDYEVAIEEGATHIRLGTALFGQRG
ncbi:MAG: YggS family pyridoxal phosphate-dependent enzyme [Bacteroidota bacterium]